MASTKMAMLRDVLASPAAARVLVFSRFTSFLVRAAAAAEGDWGVAVLRVDGTVSAADRERACSAFSSSPAGGTTALFISVKAGGEGLNLPAADTVVLCEPYWNAPVEDQCVARAHRIGRTGPLTVVRLVVANTVEVAVAALAATKARDAAAFLDADADDEAAAAARTKNTLSIAELRSLFDVADAPGAA